MPHSFGHKDITIIWTHEEGVILVLTALTQSNVFGHFFFPEMLRSARTHWDVVFNPVLHCFSERAGMLALVDHSVVKRDVLIEPICKNHFHLVRATGIQESIKQPQLSEGKKRNIHRWLKLNFLLGLSEDEGLFNRSHLAGLKQIVENGAFLLRPTVAFYAF